MNKNKTKKYLMNIATIYNNNYYIEINYVLINRKAIKNQIIKMRKKMNEYQKIYL
jgi:hypothetical protein